MHYQTFAVIGRYIQRSRDPEIQRYASVAAVIPLYRRGRQFVSVPMLRSLARCSTFWAKQIWIVVQYDHPDCALLKTQKFSKKWYTISLYRQSAGIRVVHEAYKFQGG